MRSDRQPVAADGNGLGLFLQFLRRLDLPLIATGCDHWAPIKAPSFVAGPDDTRDMIGRNALDAFLRRGLEPTPNRTGCSDR
jgi:hypothetical protein